jgi:hypothetical protein
MNLVATGARIPASVVDLVIGVQHRQSVNDLPTYTYVRTYILSLLPTLVREIGERSRNAGGKT